MSAIHANVDLAAIRRELTAILDILDERRWAKGKMAVDADGNAIGPESSCAVSYCVQGAFVRATGNLSFAGYRLGMRVLHESAREISHGRFGNLFEFNDAVSTTLADIKALVRCATAKIEAMTSAKPADNGSSAA